MNIAEAFIRRPVMTTLSSLAIVLFGLMAYRYLPVNDLPNVDFPTIVVSASLPGASPETMASSVATPLEEAVLDNRGPGLNDLEQHPGLDQHHAAIQSDAEHRRRRAGCAGGDRGDASRTAAGDAESAVVSQSQSRGSADSLHRTQLDHDADFAGRRVRRDVPRRAHLDGQRRRAGAGVRIAKVRGADSARSQGTRDTRHRHRRGLDRDSECQRRYADRHAVRPSPGVHGRHQGAVDQRGGVPVFDCRLSKRFAGAARRRRARARQRAGRQDRGLGQRRAVGGAGGPASAGDEHGRGGRTTSCG